MHTGVGIETGYQGSYFGEQRLHSGIMPALDVGETSGTVDTPGFLSAVRVDVDGYMIEGIYTLHVNTNAASGGLMSNIREGEVSLDESKADAAQSKEWA